MSDINKNKNIKDSSLDNREVKVNEDGTVEVTETVTTVYEQNARDFLSDIRNLESTRERIEETLTEDFKKQQEEQIEKIDKELKELRPYAKEADNLARDYQEKQRKKTMKENLKAELSKADKDINLNYLAGAYENLSANEKDVIDSLSSDDKAKLKRLVAKAKRKK